MRVLTLLKSGHGGRWAVQQLAYLQALGVESMILMPEGRTAEMARGLGVTVNPIGNEADPGNRTVLQCWPAHIRHLVEVWSPEVIHSHFVATTLAARLALIGGRGPSIVFQVPGPLHLEQRVTRQLDIWSSRRRDRWIAGCQASARLLVEGGVDRARVACAYYAGDTGRWDRLPDRPTEANRLPTGKIVLGMVAYTYAPRHRFRGRGLKGHEDFLRAVEVLLKRGHPVHALLIGGPWAGAEAYHTELQREAERRLGVHHTWLPSVPDALPWYRAINVAVHPSLSENLGGAAESMRAGVVTVATNVGGFPDLIQDGVTGFLAPPSDPVGLADSIERALYNMSGGIGERGRLHALDLLDPVRNAAEVSRVLANAAGGQGG